MSESEKTSDILKRLRVDHNCFTFKIAGSFYQMNGVPDCIIIKDGITIWIEFKEAKGLIKPLQQKVVEQMRKHGANVFFVRFTSTKEWVVNEGEYSIKFTRLSAGVGLLLDLLLKLSNKEVVA